MKTPEERLWDWLQINCPTDSWGIKYDRKFFNYITKYWQPKHKIPLNKCNERAHKN